MTNYRLQVLTFLVLLCTQAVQPASAQTDSELLQQLRADYYSLLDAMEEYEIAGEDYNMSSGEKEDYSHWINQLKEQFNVTCHAFTDQPNLESSPDIPCDEYASSNKPSVNIDIERESTDGEKTASIEEQFNDSLGGFDEKLLREQDRVKAMKPQNTSSQSGGGSGGGSGTTGDGDGESGDGESGDGEQTDQQSGEQSGRQSDQQGTDQRDNGARGKPQAGNRSNTPDDIPDGNDDDVVARQLREAAERETDPELRAKLWEEYRRYKQGQ